MLPAPTYPPCEGRPRHVQAQTACLHQSRAQKSPTQLMNDLSSFRTHAFKKTHLQSEKGRRIFTEEKLKREIFFVIKHLYLEIKRQPLFLFPKYSNL